MKALELDPEGYDGTYKLIGEEICLDFINTISWQNTEWEHDWLHTPNNFIKWALATKIINEKKAKMFKTLPVILLRKQMAEVYAVRKNLYEILTDFAFQKKINPDKIKKLDLMVHKIFEHRHINSSNYEWIWNEPKTLHDVLSPVIWNAAQIITESDHSRIKYCSSCNWLFYDKTKNKSRKWCDMEDCGSRDKSLRYYHRQKK